MLLINQIYNRFIIASLVALSGAPIALSNTGERTDTILTLPQVEVTSVKSGIGTLRNKPMAATVVTAAEVSRQGIVNMHQISEVAPNFYIPAYGSRVTSSIYVRGIGARIDQPAVGLTVDNVAILNKDNYDFDLDNIIKVEMIRGPQSTLYGRNTMCGMISVATLSPLQYQGVKASVEGASHGSYRASVGAYETFCGGRLGLAAGAAVNGTDGYYHNQYNGSHVGRERNWSAWYKAAWRPSPSLSIENTGRFTSYRQSGYAYESLATSTIAYNDTCFYRRNSFIDGLTVAYRSGAWSLTSITSLQYINDNMTLDQDFLPESFFTLTQRRHETAVTEDIILSHTSDHYDWLTGVYGFIRHSRMSAPVTFLPTGIARLIEDHRNQVNPYYPIKWDDDSFVLNSEFSLPYKGIGLYHSSNYRWRNWTFTAALRLEIERPEIDYHSFTSTSYTIWDMTHEIPSIFRNEKVDLDETGRLSHTYVELLPRLSAVYALPDRLGNVYASFAKGHKSGGYNTQMFSDFLQQKLMATMGMSELYNADEIISYRPEKSYNYEIGSHLTLFDGKLNLDATLFYIDCRDQQLTRFPDGSTTGRIMTNAGKTRSIGAELTAAWQISRHLDLTATWGHADARFRHYDDGINDYSDKFLPYAPINTAFAALRYHTDFNDGWLDSFECMASLRGIGPIYWNETNTARQSFYAPINLSAMATSGIFQLRIWAENVNSVHYSTFYFKSMGNEFVQRGLPFRAGATLRIDIDIADR
ncbi:MAG: TonB-dependent receptor [Bacteroidales bacterium]|nr:TonB-dependent receptor [Bacteroidales bacterium]